MEIQGVSAASTTVSAAITARIFHVVSGELTLSEVTIADGDSSLLHGGGIRVDAGASLDLSRVLITNNSATFGGDGAGLYNAGTATLQDVELSGNTANSDGGGIYNTGSLTLNRVTLANNEATNGDGGGVFHSGTLLTIDNSTLSGNGTDAASGGAGGGLLAEAAATITSSTIVDNSSKEGGGGIRVMPGGSVTLSNSILSGNTAVDGGANEDNEQGNLTSLGFNVIEDIESASAIATDILVADPGLDVLAAGEGFVRTHAPTAGSAAINAGSTTASTTDASGISANEIRDIGAHEYTTATGVLYFTDAVDTIFRTDANGANQQELLTGRNAPGNIEVDLANGRLYWLEAGTELFSAKLDGTDVQSELSGFTDAVSFALDIATQHVFILFNAAVGIRDYDLVTDIGADVASGGFNDPKDIELDASSGTLFWSDWGTNPSNVAINQVDTDGSSRAEFVPSTELKNPSGLAFDQATDRLHWVDSSWDEVYYTDFPAGAPYVSTGITAGDVAALVHNTLNNTFLLTSPTDSDLESVTAALDGNTTVADFAGETITGLAFAATSAVTTAPSIDTNAGATLDEGATLQLGTSVLESNDSNTTDSNLDYTIADEVDFGRLYHVDTSGVHVTTFTEQELKDGDIYYVHDGTENHSDSFSFNVTDGTSTTGVTTFLLTLTPINSNTPVAGADALTVDEGGSVTLLTGGDDSVLDNDTDADLPGDTLSATIDTGPSNGTLTLNADGTFIYTHDGSETTSDSFTYTVDDGGGRSTTGTVTVTVTPDNDAPVGVNEALTVSEGGTATTLTGGATSVLTNDTDSDVPADTLTVTLTTGPANGTVTLNADGTFSYTHDGSETTSDSFTYTVDDGAGGTDTAIVSITVTPANDAPVGVNDALTVSEGGTATTLTGGATSVLTNDTDSDVPTDTLSVTVNSGPSNGTLTLNTDGTFSYTHDGSETISDSFTYTVDDGAGGTDTATVSITVTPDNDAPVGVNETLTVVEGGTATTLTGGATSVLSNDTDSDVPADTLSVTVDSGPSNGTLTLNADGTFSYTHNGSETTSDSFTYTVDDGAGGTDTATVSITVTPDNDAPVGVDETLTVAEGGTATALTGGATSVLTNDTDSDVPADTLTVTLTTGPANGSVTLNADGTFSYTHDGSETTSDSFSYTVDDGAGGTDTATVSITVTPDNDAPVGVDDTLTVLEGSTSTVLTGGATSVLTNDSDPDLPGDTLNVSLNAGPVNGSVTLNADGTFSYTHDGSETTSDSFTYTVDDGAGGTDTATVSITVTPENDVPVGVDEALTLTEGGTATTLTGGATSVLTNDTDSDVPADTLTVSLTTGPASGSVTLNADGTFNYTHDGSETTNDSFSYTVDDGAGGTDTATVSITVTPANDAPVGVNETLTVAEGGTATTLTGGATTVLANDSDADVPADTLTVSLTTGPANGTATLNSDGTFSYTHDGSATTTDSFIYTVNDGAGGTDTATVNVSIFATNDAPIGINDTLSVLEGSTSTVLTGGATSVLTNDSDPDLPGDTLTVSLTAGPVNGSVTLNADGSFSYTHDGSETTSDSFSYTVDDGAGGTDTATVSITVTPGNDAPLATDDSLSIAGGGTLGILTGGATTVLANDNDADVSADTLTVSLTTGPANGTVTLNSDGTFSYTHDGSATTTDSYIYTVNDGAGGTDTATVNVSISATNDAPIGINDTLTVLEGSTSTVLTGGATSVLTNDSDPDLPGDTLTVSLTVGPVNGSVTLNADGSFSYTHDGSETTSDSFTYTVDDGAGGTDTATVTVTVIPGVDEPLSLVGLSNTRVSENVAGAIVGVLQTTGGQDGATLTFSVDDARFVVRGATLELAAGQSLD